MRFNKQAVKVVGIALALAPCLANAIPIVYSFTAELTSFSSRIDGAQRSLESVASRDITGFLAYDTDRMEQVDDTFILASGLSGDGFQFEANSARILGSQAISLRDEPVDQAVFFEFFEYETLNRIFTSYMEVDLFGVDLLDERTAASSTLDVSRFEYGSGYFGYSGADLLTGETDNIGGQFNVTSISSGPLNVPEPSALILFVTSLFFVMLRRRDAARAIAA